MMQLVFVHGWSVTNTNTYGGLPEALAAAATASGMKLDIRHIQLGRYISFRDEVTVDDIARAMDKALRELPGNSADHIAPFSCITHSTGGPVVRLWIDRFYGEDGLAGLPLTHLVMLAPANHGSALAVLGKGRVGRIKAWFNGVDPGQRVLDWLCLGSAGQWRLNERYLQYDYAAHGFYPFVLTGQGIDRKLYDFLNSYLVEPGSDGVVRVAGANMNYQYLSLWQNPRQLLRQRPPTFVLEAVGGERTSPSVPLGVYRDYSHSGTRMGIMAGIKASAKKAAVEAPVVQDIVKCLLVQSPDAYLECGSKLAAETAAQQQGADRYCMLVFNVHDDQGGQLGENDYDLLLLAGNNYQPNLLPAGFFQDKQMNRQTGRLVYYLDADRMAAVRDGKFGLRVVARPSAGFSYYCMGEYHGDGSILEANQTIYVDITLHRFVDENVFRFDPADAPRRSFRNIRPSGKTLG